MGLKPQYRVTANDKDISVMISQRLENIRITDEVGLESDMLEISLVDDGVKFPPTGAELRIFVGYDEKLRDMGLFVVDEIELSGWPAKMVIRARASVQDNTPKGKKTLTSQQSKEWKKDTTIGAIAQKIAKDHEMTASVSKDLADINVPHLMQTDESDLNFLIRIVKKYDGVVKPANGKIVIVKMGSGKTASGEDLPTITIKKTDCSDYRLTTASKDKSGTVVAYYHLHKDGKRYEVSSGSGEEPIKRIKMAYSTKEEAEWAAKSEFDRRERKKTTLNITIAGNHKVTAETPLIMEGFRDGISGQKWIIKRAEHNLTDKAYITSIEAERMI